MATNDFLGFANDPTANVMSQADFAASTEKNKGVQSGPALSTLCNKIWRQGANMAAAIGQMIAGQGQNALDNGDIAMLETALETALGTIGVISATTAYYRLSNGLQILTGNNGSSSSGPVRVNFSHAFAEIPRVIMQEYGVTTTNFVAKCDVTDTTGFDFVCVTPNNEYINGASTRWIAFGIGA